MKMRQKICDESKSKACGKKYQLGDFSTVGPYKTETTLKEEKDGIIHKYI
jgi:hypothetical protein